MRNESVDNQQNTVKREAEISMVPNAEEYMLLLPRCIYKPFLWLAGILSISALFLAVVFGIGGMVWEPLNQIGLSIERWYFNLIETLPLKNLEMIDSEFMLLLCAYCVLHFIGCLIVCYKTIRDCRRYRKFTKLYFTDTTVFGKTWSSNFQCEIKNIQTLSIKAYHFFKFLWIRMGQYTILRISTSGDNIEFHLSKSDGLNFKNELQNMIDKK